MISQNNLLEFPTKKKNAAFGASGELGSQWIEMKFTDELPQCRTWHAQTTYNERLFMYGGTDMKQNDSPSNELWYIDPLSYDAPKWNKIEVSDFNNHVLPDGIKGHQLAIRVIGPKKILMIIGGQRTFINAERRYLEKMTNNINVSEDSIIYDKPSFVYGIEFVDDSNGMMTATTLKLSMAQQNHLTID